MVSGGIVTGHRPCASPPRKPRIVGAARQSGPPRKPRIVGAARQSGSAALVLLLVVAAASSRASSRPRREPGAVPLVGTGGGASWARTRLAALERHGVTGEIALSVLAQWAHETDSGRAEWNFNVGNLRPVGNQPRIDLGPAGFFRAYGTLDEGVSAYLALVQSGRYTPCWGLLNADPTSEDWIRCLGRLGYYCEHAAPCTETEISAYARAWGAHRAVLGRR
jgi:hypothetical protein